MSQPIALVDYASEGLQQPSDRLLRKIVAGLALAEGGIPLVCTALHIGLARHWLRSPNTMGWDFDGTWDIVCIAVSSIIESVMLVGGVLLMMNARGGIVIVRWSAIGAILMSIVATALTMQHIPTYASYWSTPATAAMNALQLIDGFLPRILLALLTLPPLARRMT